MSLHAQLSQDAAERLHAQKRNSTISSVIISVLVLVLIALVLFLFTIQGFFVETPTIVTYSAGLEDKDKIEKKQINNQIQRKPSAPSSAMSKVIASTTPSPVAIPVPEIDVPEPSTDFGSGDDFGDGWGSGDGAGGGGFVNIPASMRKRCSAADRLARLKANGGNAQCEEAVMKSLRWLKKTQNEDGSWTGKDHAAMTGFAILAFLGHCETPLSEEFGDAVMDGIVYLVNVGMKNGGRLTVNALESNHWVYEHGIATYALAESYTFCSQLGINIPDLGEVTKLAGDIIIEGQGDSGGWVYKYASTADGDNSVGFWQIQALKACKHTGLWEDKDFKTVSRKALEWLDIAQGKDGSIGYRGDSSGNPGLTGGGVLAFQMWGKGSSKNARAGVKYISKNTAFNWADKTSNLYYHYYNAQAMINHGGKDWENYNLLFRDILLNNQQEDGTWKHAGTGHSNLLMNTCLATFMLEVYYRFLPATGAGTR
jgi:hypothetical protein